MDPLSALADSVANLAERVSEGGRASRFAWVAVAVLLLAVGAVCVWLVWGGK
jgi:hypothetical protein